MALAAGCGEASLGEPPDVRYRASLAPLNGSGVTGDAELTVDLADDAFRARVDAGGLAPGTPHLQHVHLSAPCPGPADDANGDGYVDFLEGVARYGPILLPLDDVLAVQGAGAFPMAEDGGGLSYREEERLSSVLADLRRDDPDPDDLLAKLEEGEGLALDARTVVLHGVAASADLPGTVATPPGTDARATLPVACGELFQAR